VTLLAEISRTKLARDATRPGAALGFVPLPGLYWPLVAAMLLSYSVLTHLVKVWFTNEWGL
jgi:P-type Mg2+ transporter